MQFLAERSNSVTDKSYHESLYFRKSMHSGGCNNVYGKESRIKQGLICLFLVYAKFTRQFFFFFFFFFLQHLLISSNSNKSTFNSCCHRISTDGLEA